MASISTKRTGKRTSVHDVARRAGVSVGTVSNVLNRPDRVTEATRTRVHDAIEALSFVPNASARHLRVGSIATVGAILLDIRNPFFTEMARGIEDRISQDDQTLMLASSDEDLERETKYLQLFERQGIKGLLVVPATPEVDHLLALVDRGVPVVMLDSPSPTPLIGSVAVDNVLGGGLAARHLLELGHRALTFINGPHTIRQCQDRSTGVRQAVADAGLDPDETVTELTINSLDAAGGDAALTSVLDAKAGPAPSAVFCVNDLVAIGVQRALRRSGLIGDVALVGYDDIEVASELALPLTSVRQPTHDIGYRAGEVLLSGNDPEHIVFEPELVIRASSDPAAS